MEQTWTIFGALGEWRLTVTLVPDPDDRLDETAARRALGRFSSLDPHFWDVVNLAEALELAER